MQELLTRIHTRRKRIVIIGDVIVDRWIHGHTEDSQDGCKKFIENDITTTPGGAANAENSLKHWEVLSGVYGQPTDDCCIKYRYVENGKIIFRADKEHCSRGHYWQQNLGLEFTKTASAVLLSDYDKGFLTPDFLSSVIKTCQQRGIPCVADCKRQPSLYNGCILKGNHEYFSKYAEQARTRTSRAISTCGPYYPLIWDMGYIVAENNRPAVKCVNHVGAGDCFAAHLTMALGYGFSLKEAVALAHSAGRVYVQHPHNQPPHPSAIAKDLASAK